MEENDFEKSFHKYWQGNGEVDFPFAPMTFILLGHPNKKTNRTS
jgi:hypothetical protein